MNKKQAVKKKPAQRVYFLPGHGISVEATSPEEAVKKSLKQPKKESEATNGDL